MKSVLVVLALASLAFAEDIDWSTVKRRDIRLPLPFDLDQVIWDEKIVGGNEAVENSVPYQVGLLIRVGQDNFFCGGSLISTRYVLTAAHCVDGASQIEVRLGAHRIQNADEHTIRITNSFIVHAGWNSALIRNDIALVDLITPVELSSVIQVVTMPRFSDVGNSFAGSLGRISGWGLAFDGATSISEVLRVVFADVITNFTCNLRFLGMIQATHICTSGEGGRGACSGDSGGPLVVGQIQVGIVSFGLGLGCELGWPSAFTRVTSFLDFIDANSDVTIV